jgi:hypothetical protein
MAVKGNRAVQDIDVPALVAKLRESGAVMEYRPAVLPPGFFNGLFSKYLPGYSSRQQIQ